MNNWIKPQWIEFSAVLEHMTEAKGDVSEFHNKRKTI